MGGRASGRSSQRRTSGLYRLEQNSGGGGCYGAADMRAVTIVPGPSSESIVPTDWFLGGQRQSYADEASRQPSPSLGLSRGGGAVLKAFDRT